MAHPTHRKFITGITKSVLLLALTCSAWAERVPDILPLPGEGFREDSEEKQDLVNELTDRFVGTTGGIHFEIPDSFVVENEGGEILYDGEKKTITYTGENKIRLRANSGLDVESEQITADLENTRAAMSGAISIYQGEMFARARNGSYDWNGKKLTAEDFRSKLNGMIIHGDTVEYGTDANGQQYVHILGASVSTDDVQEPSVWLKAKELTVYPGDTGELTGLGMDWGSLSVTIPFIPISHSLNPEEGYMPALGTKSIWGSFLQNRYGFLLGNRRVQGGIPVADYVLTTRLDYRSRRGFAYGLDLKDCDMKDKFDMDGISLYYISDDDPNISPTSRRRKGVSPDRYRLAMQAMWILDLPKGPDNAKWTAQTNINAVSDQYVLRDYFESIGSVNDKPDNMVKIERKTDTGQLVGWGRYAFNDYYATDERAELTHYHVRSSLWGSRIAYESRSGTAIIRQYLPDTQIASFKNKLNKVKDPDLKDYYARMLNTTAYARANSTHEVTTNIKLFDAISITPKAGAGYSGYYDVEDIGTDNRLIGYLGCDFQAKFYRNYESVSLPWLGGHGLMHVMRPYVTLTHCNASSSNPRVPKVDVWSTTLSNSSSNPMDLDLLGFTSIDSWGTWSICRLGLSNVFTTHVDETPFKLLSVNCFIDYNAENPNSPNPFSNLYTNITFQPSRFYKFSLEALTPTIKDGDGYRQYNTSVTVQPCSWFEATMGHSYINGHSLIKDASQAYIRSTIRINEKVTLAARVSWDIEEKRFPIQQYGAFRKWGPWYVGATVFLRNNGGRKEAGFGISFILTEIGTALPIEFL